MGSPGTDDGCGHLEEDDWRGGQLHAGLAGVIAVVEADGEDPRRVGQRRVELDFAEAVANVDAGLPGDFPDAGADGAQGVEAAGWR